MKRLTLRKGMAQGVSLEAAGLQELEIMADWVLHMIA